MNEEMNKQIKSPTNTQQNVDIQVITWTHFPTNPIRQPFL